MKRFGLIGHPIAHSLSPALFKAGYDGMYPYELIENADFEEAYKTFLQEYDGVNVTAPFKEMAFAKADVVSQECEIIGATNLLVKTPEGVKAYNSDFLGVQLCLQEMMPSLSVDITGKKRTPPTSWAPPPAARGAARFSPSVTSTDKAGKKEADKGSEGHLKVLISGLGGAGKAAAVAAASLGSGCILMNRSIEKAEAMAGSLSEMGYIAEARPMSDFRECFREADIIIYNIPGPIPQLDELTKEDLAAGKPKAILEANYKDPSFTEDMIKRMTGVNPLLKYTGGRKWLLYQALTGYEIFTGKKPDLQRMSDVL